MKLERGVLAAVLIGGLASPGWAQQAGTPPRAAVDATQLGIDLGRIQRQLRQTASRADAGGLNLKYYIDVYATAPRLQLFANRDEALHGPVPYGEPTHREMLEMSTPQEYRAPAMDFSALMRWLHDHSK